MRLSRLLPIKSLAAAAACLLTALSMSAYDYMQDGIYYSITEYDDGSAVAAVANNGSFNTYSGDVVIPSTVNYYGKDCDVVSIGYQAFKNSTGLTSVTLPETVVYLSNEAFAGCTSLTSITIPNSASTIYNYVFTGCTNLRTIICKRATARSCNTNNFDAATYSSATLYVPVGSLDSYQSTAPWSSFANIKELTQFEVDGICYKITGDNTVEVTYRDTNYNSYSGIVNIPSTVDFGGQTYQVTAIGRLAFYQCTELTQVYITESVTHIGYCAFYGCAALEGINHPYGVTYIDEFAFGFCISLKSIALRDGLTYIGRQAFHNCVALQSLTVPSTVNSIGPFAFYNCSGLRSLVLRNGLQEILNSAFGGCTSLTRVSIPASVTYIAPAAFAECTSMQLFSVSTANANYCAVNGVLYTADKDTLIAFPNMNTQHYVIPDGVKAIGYEAFSGCTNLQSVVIPDGLSFIDFRAFYGSSLSTVEIPASVTHIDGSVFGSCHQLVSIQVDDDNPAFVSDDGVLYSRDYTRLLQYPCLRQGKHYTIMNSVTQMDDLAFEQASYLKSVYVPGGIKEIGAWTFSYSSLERVVLDEGVEYIGQNAFAGCANLQSVYLPSTITMLDLGAFQVTPMLTEIVCAASNPPEQQQNYVFYYSGADADHTTLYVPAGATSNYSSNDLWNWATVTPISPIASGTEFTVDSLMYKTTDAQLNASVTGVTSKNILDPGIPPKVAYQGNLCTVTRLGSNSLQNCTKMVRAEVPFTVTLMDGYAFYGCSQLQQLRLHEGLKQINQFSVSHDTSLTTLSIPASVDSISGSFVTYSTALNNIEVDAANTHYTSINGVLFSKDKKRLVAYPNNNSTSYSVPTGTEVIGSDAFRGASPLQAVTLPSTLKCVESSAFFDNTGISEIIVPKGVTTIGSSAFSYCQSLTTAELPSTLTSLGHNAFNATPQLTTLRVRATTPPTCEIYLDPRMGTMLYPFNDSHFSNCELIVPRGTKAAYQAASIWRNFLNITETDYPAEFKRGDVNNDNTVDIDDVTQLISYVLGNGNSINLAAADVNEDGHIDIDDITVIINYILNGSWPEPADIDLWYLVGNRVGSTPWVNEVNSVGKGLIPLYPAGPFNAQGKGLLTYTGFFGPEEWLIVIHQPGSWDEKAGANVNGEYGIGEGFDAFMAYDYGYYTISMNTATGEFTFAPYTGPTPVGHSSMNMPGAYSNWDVTDESFNMTGINTMKENHDWWMQTATYGYDGDLKFAADNDWTYNWGAEEFPYGIGVQNGLNIPVKAGTYDVFFNDITGHYNFIKK